MAGQINIMTILMNKFIIHLTKLKPLFTPDKYKIIVIPSYRTPERVIKKAYNTFSFNHHVIKEINKKPICALLQ